MTASHHGTFLLTRPSRGATKPFHIGGVNQIISTHTPLAGRDHHNGTGCQGRRTSTHTPLARRDVTPANGIMDNARFLLTRPSRGATYLPGHSAGHILYFYSHAPRGARHKSSGGKDANSRFLLTRPSRGATGGEQTERPINVFLLTRPSRGATLSICSSLSSRTISTHTPLAGRDRRSHPLLHRQQISTHTPLAGRDLMNLS